MILQTYDNLTYADIASKIANIEHYTQSMFFISILTEKMSQDNNIYKKLPDRSPGYSIKESYFNEIAEENEINLVKYDLRNGETKLFVQIDQGFHHFFMDSINSIILFNKKFPDATIIIDYNFGEESENKKESSFLKFLKQYLDFNNIKYKFLASNYLVAIDNFYIVDRVYLSDIGIATLRDEIQKVFNNNLKPPYKKVYVSRRMHQTHLKKRIEDEEILEEFFQNKGFEIIYPENFKNFEEQANYFSEVHTIASTTSSGFTNMLFMKPGGRVIDIICPMGIAPNGLSYIACNLYLEMSYCCDHIYQGIPAKKNAKSLVEYIKNIDFNF